MTNQEGHEDNGVVREQPAMSEPEETQAPEEPAGLAPIRLQADENGHILWTEAAVDRLNRSPAFAPLLQQVINGAPINARDVHRRLREANIEVIIPRVARPAAPPVSVPVQPARVINGQHRPQPAAAPTTPAVPATATPAQNESEPAKKQQVVLTRKQVEKLLHTMPLDALLNAAGARLTEELADQFPGCELAIVLSADDGPYVSLSVPPDEDEGPDAEPVVLAHTKKGIPPHALGNATDQVFKIGHPALDTYLRQLDEQTSAAGANEAKEHDTKR